MATTKEHDIAEILYACGDMEAYNEAERAASAVTAHFDKIQAIMAEDKQLR